MKLSNLENKKILVVGKGIEGLASYKFLKNKLKNSQIDIVDLREDKDYLKNQLEYDIAVKSPGIKSDLLKITYTTPTNIFMSNAKGKIIGISGTKGKSTTTTLIYLMLRQQGFDAYMGGNIGQSPLDFLDKLNDQSWTVLELSSFQLKDMEISPHISVLLMIAPEHLDYHVTMEDYVYAKRNILRAQSREDFAVINRDYPASNESDIETEADVFKVSREREVNLGCFVKDESVWIRNRGKDLEIIKIKEIGLRGEHNLENVCAATMAAFLAGVSKNSIVSVLKNFGGLEHRLEFVDEVNGVKFYNDSLATIPEATIGALNALKDTETLITGGFDRGLDFWKLGEKIAESEVKTLILFPVTGEKIWEAVCNVTTNLPEKFEVKTMREAVRIAFAETQPGKICLMSPASASFNLFKNYKDRGEQFKKEVQILKD